MIEFEKLPWDETSLEVVERKGLGHPDTLCDTIAEKTSQLYSQYVSTTFGNRFAHHWFDKVMLVGGESEFAFGHGRLTEPYNIYLVGKAVRRVGSHEIPLDRLFTDACREVLTETLTDFKFDEWAKMHLLVSDYQGPQNKKNRYRPGHADDLVVITPERTQHSNDCNFCCSHYPYSVTERLVLEIENHLNHRDTKRKRPYLGCDIKLFATRRERSIRLLIRLPFVAVYTPSLAFYYAQKEEVRVELVEIAKVIAGGHAVDIQINEGDPAGECYLTVTGTVADTGDVGVVGRGNRANGLITPMKPMSIEAAAGKNPLDHTGKLYSLAARKIAQKVSEITNQYVEVYVNSSKHANLEDADSVLVRSAGELTPEHRDRAKRCIVDELARIQDYTGEFVRGEHTLW